MNQKHANGEHVTSRLPIRGYSHHRVGFFGNADKPIRWALGFLFAVAFAFAPFSVRAQEKPPSAPPGETKVKTGTEATPAKKADEGGKSPGPGTGSKNPKFVPDLGWDDAPARFVPKRPRTVEERRQWEAIRSYSLARAKEKQRDWRGALVLLEQALKNAPDSPAILRRLSQLNLALGRVTRGIEYARAVLKADPNDTATLQLVVTYYEQIKDANTAETILKEILADPKLPKKSASAILAYRNLGLLYIMQDGKLAAAADAFEKVLDALDDKAVNAMSPGEQRRLLGEPALTYLSFGEVFFQVGRLDPALKSFRRGLVYDPGNENLVSRLAETLLKKGDPNEALKTIDPLIAARTATPRAYQLWSEILTQLKRTQDILPRLEEAAQADPGNLAVQIVLAEQYAIAGQKTKADALLERLVDAKSNNTQALAGLANLLRKERKAEPLLKILSRTMAKPNGIIALQQVLTSLVDEDPAFIKEIVDKGLKLITGPEPMDNNLQQLLAELATKSKNSDALVALSRLAFQRNPSRQNTIELIFALTSADKNREAAETLGQYLEKNPKEKNPRFLIMLGTFQNKAGDVKAAVASARAARDLGEVDPDIQRNLVTLLCDTAEFDDALALAKKLLQADPNEPKNVYINYHVNDKAKRFDDALAVVRNALERNPAEPMYNSLFGDALEKLGRDEEAIAHYRVVQEKYPQNERIVVSMGQRLSALHVRRNEIVKGQEVLETLLKKYPEDAGINNDLGYLYADQGVQLVKAEKMIRRALEEEPENSSYLDSFGWALFKQGKTREAAKYLERAIANFPFQDGDATLQDHLGDIYFELKDYSKARDAWKRAEEASKKMFPPDNRFKEIPKKFKLLDKVLAAPRSANSPNP